MTSNFPQPESASSRSADEQRKANFLSHLVRSDTVQADFRMESRFTVDAHWMQLSVRNARASLSSQNFQIKGFRPGKAPSVLIENKLQKRAVALALQWITHDLSEMLMEDPDLVMLSAIEEKRENTWGGSNEPFVTTFLYKAWKYPALSVDDLIRGLTAQSGPVVDAELESRAFDYLSQNVIPPHIENEILREIDSHVLLSSNGADTALSIRRAIADTMIARVLGVEATEEDVEHALGVLAIEQKKSLIEIQEEMEPQIEIFRQHIESQMTYASLREQLVGRGIELVAE